MKIGYIQKRSSLISELEQIAELIKAGIDIEHIYAPADGLFQAISSCREVDTLVVWSAAVLGNLASATPINALS